MNILNKLGHKQRIVIAISLVLAVISYFIPEPKQTREPLLLPTNAETTFKPAVTVMPPSPSIKRFADAMEQAIDIDPLPSPAEQDLTLQIKINQSPSQHTVSLDSDDRSSADSFTITTTPHFFHLELPQLLSIHQLPLNE